MADTAKFIKTLAPLAQVEKKKRDKWVLPSVCIAQAALETGWGTSLLMTRAKAYFGIKATKSWKGKVYSTRTRECYDGKNFVNITDCFRAYDSLADSVADYYDLICNNKRYAGAVNNGNYVSAITAIKNGGYATDPNYVKNVCSIIKKYNLTKYDNVSGKSTAASKPSTTSKPSNKVTVYEVQKGDTLTAIAKKYKTTVKHLVEINNIKNPNLIYVGQKLKI